MDIPISAERLSQLVGLIYEAAIDASRWGVAGQAIRDELNCCNSTLDLMELPSGRAISRAITGVPEEYLPIMAGAGPDVLEQWGGAEVAMSLPLDRPAVLTHVNPAFDPDTTTNGYYLRFAKPQGITDVLAIALARDERAIGTLSFGRHGDAGPFGARELAIVELLIPHLQRAATINRLLDTAAAARDTFEATLDVVAVPIVLVGPALRIVHANRGATKLMEQGDLIREQNGTLVVRSPGAASALGVAIGQAMREEARLGRRGLGIPLSGDGKSGALHVMPLGNRRGRSNRDAVAAVFVADLDSPFVAPSEVVAALFDLTRAETGVFKHLVQGMSVTQIAEALGIGRATVRTHLSRLYEKTDTHRQSSLIQIATSLSVPVATL